MTCCAMVLEFATKPWKCATVALMACVAQLVKRLVVLAGVSPALGTEAVTQFQGNVPATPAGREPDVTL